MWQEEWVIRSRTAQHCCTALALRVPPALCSAGYTPWGRLRCSGLQAIPPWAAAESLQNPENLLNQHLAEVCFAEAVGHSFFESLMVTSRTLVFVALKNRQSLQQHIELLKQKFGCDFFTSWLKQQKVAWQNRVRPRDTYFPKNTIRSLALSKTSPLSATSPCLSHITCKHTQHSSIKVQTLQNVLKYLRIKLWWKHFQ